MCCKKVAEKKKEGKEAQTRFDQLFDETTVLLDQIVEVFDLPQFHGSTIGCACEWSKATMTYPDQRSGGFRGAR